MASMIWRTLTKSNPCYFALRTTVRVTQFSPLALPKTMDFLGRSIAVGPSAPTVFGRPYSSDQPGYLKAPQLQVEEDKKKPEMEKENEEPLEKKEPGVDVKKDEGGPRTAEITELYNTSQKILIACVGDLSHAHRIALALGDASKIVVISPYSCGELEMRYGNARSHILDLTKLGARIVFNVDLKEFAKDSRINHMCFDRVLLDLA